MSNSTNHPSKPEPVAGNVERYKTDGGGQIFRIPVNAFPGLWGYVYAVLVEDYRVLIDSGSGFGEFKPASGSGLEISQQPGWYGCDFAEPDAHFDHARAYRSFRRLELCAPADIRQDWHPRARPEQRDQPCGAFVHRFSPPG